MAFTNIMALTDVSTPTVAVYAACLLTVYTFITVAYRLTFHPLRKYPGPFLAKTTNAYGGFHSIRARLAWVVYDNHQKYGSVVRMGPNRLVFNTATALHDIHQNARVNKSQVYALSRMMPNPTTLDSVDIQEHRRKRKNISQPFSEKRLRTFEPTMVEEIDKFVDMLQESSRHSEPVNMSTACGRLAGNVIGQQAFGYDLELFTKEKNRWLLPGLLYVAHRINVLMNFPELKFFDPLAKTLAWKARQGYIKIVRSMIEARTALDKDAKFDFYSMAVDHLQVGTSLRDSELWTEAFLYISAGGNTISPAMSAMFFYLSRYPQCYKKLADEIRSTFPSKDEIQSGPTLQSCRYLRACINETLRIATPNPGVMWREQIDNDEEPLVIDGHIIPRGTLIGVCLYALHHNEEYWPEPSVFKPERWLSESGDLITTHKAFAPFLIGSRNCAGKAMALQEMTLTFARTLWQLDFEPAAGTLGKVGEVPARDGTKQLWDQYELSDKFSAGHDGPYLVFHPRTNI